MPRIRRMGGVVRVSELIERGHPRAEIGRLLTAGALVRPVRGWIALRDADPGLVHAARHHVVLSCVTQATRLGLWVPEQPRDPHVAPPNAGAKVRASPFVVHWTRPLILRSPYLLVDPLENVLAHVAECQPRDAALTIWESALNKRMTDVQSLGRLPLRAKARDLLAQSTPFSDSGLESLVYDRLRWLPMPVRQQVHVHGKRVDLLIGQRLVIQIDGATHVGRQRTADNNHDAELEHRGYHVIRLAYEQVMHRWEEAQGLILDAIARGKHLA